MSVPHESHSERYSVETGWKTDENNSNYNRKKFSESLPKCFGQSINANSLI